MDHPSPNGPDDSPGFLLWRVSLGWQRRMAAVLKPLGLTHPQFVLLASAGWLAGQGGPATQRGLADHAGTDPMTTSQVLRTLEAKGLLERLDDPADARAKRVSLTAAGRELLTVAVPAVEETDAEFFAAVSRPQALTLLTSLLKEAKRT